jgi:rhodanese-related sulfurtransferase
MWHYLFAFAIIAYATYSLVKETVMSKIISRSSLQDRMADNPNLVLLEALPEKYFVEGHLPGALHFPHDQVPALAWTLPQDKNAEIVVYCASKTCNNSHIAAGQLGQLGYTNVAVYSGGKQDWSEAGLALETSVVAAN